MNQSLQNVINRLWEVINVSSEMLSTVRSENRVISLQVEQLSKEKEIILEDLRRTREETLNVKSDIRKYEERLVELDSVKEAFAKLENNVTIIEKERRELAEANDVMNQDKAKSEQTINELRQELFAKENLIKRAELMEGENKALSSKLAEMLEFEKNLEIMRRELARKNADVNTHLNEIQRLKNECAEMESKLFEIPKLRDENVILKGQIEILNSEKSELLKTYDEALEYSRLHKIQQESIDSYSQQILDLKRLNGQLENEKNDKDKLIDSLQRKIDEQIMTQERLHLQLRSAREYEQQISEQLKSLDDYSAQLIEMRKIIETRDEELNTSRANERELQHLVQKEQQTIWVLNEKLHSLVSNNSELETKFSEEKSKNEKLEEKLLILENQFQEISGINELVANEKNSFLEKYETLEKDHSDIKRQFEEIQLEYKVNKDKVEAQTIEIYSLYEKLSKEESERKTLILRNEELLEENVEKNNTDAEIRRANAELELLNNSLVSKIATVEHTLEQTKEALTAATTDVETISDEKEKLSVELNDILNKSKNDLEVQKIEFEQKYSELAARLRINEEMIGQLRIEKKMVDEELIKVQEQLTVTANERDEYLEHIASAAGDNESSLKEMRSVIENTNNELRTVLRSNEELIDENTELKNQIEILMKSMEENYINIDSLNKQLTEFTTSNESSAEVEARDKVINEIVNKLSSVASKVSGMMTSSIETARSHHKMIVPPDDLEMKRLQEELKTAFAEIESANKYSASLMQEIKLLREQSDNRETRFSALRNELARLKNQTALSFENEGQLFSSGSVELRKDNSLAERIRNTLERLENILQK